MDNLQWMTWTENNDKGYADRKNGINKKSFKSVIQMDLNDKFIAKHCSMSQASRDTGINLGNIGLCCRGKYKTAGGFRWIYD